MNPSWDTKWLIPFRKTWVNWPLRYSTNMYGTPVAIGGLILQFSRCDLWVDVYLRINREKLWVDYQTQEFKQ